MNDPRLRDQFDRVLRGYLYVAVAVLLLLAALHLGAADLRLWGVYWFNLDKERNLPTWISSAVFCLFGLTALIAFHAEVDINRRRGSSFRLPACWIGVATIGFLMSLDEMTVLHENLFWREIREGTQQLGGAWMYVTQWQIVAAPVVAILLGYLLSLFLNRFARVPAALRAALGGVACFYSGFLIEGVRESVRIVAPATYRISVLFEEEFELAGGILLVLAISLYLRAILFRFTEADFETLRTRSGFMNRRTVVALTSVAVFFVAGGGLAALFASRRAAEHARLPKLQRRVRSERYERVRAGRKVSVPPKAERDRGVWFDRSPQPLPLTAGQEEKLGHFVADLVLGDPSALPALPSVLSGDHAPRIVFLSLSDGSGPARVVRGVGLGLPAALAEVTAKARSLRSAGFVPRWIRLDIVTGTRRLGRRRRTETLKISPSRHGIAFGRDTPIALLSGEIHAQRLLDSKRRLQLKRLLRYLAGRPAEQVAARRLRHRKRLTLYRFRTRALFTDGTTVIPLYRGHRNFPAVTMGELLAAARRGGEYLKRAVRADGRFDYIYDPKRDRVSPKYNILRHAGTLFAMLELYQQTRDEELLAAARRGLSYLLATVRPGIKDPERTSCIVERNAAALGGNALGILALATYTRVSGDRRYLPIMEKLGNWIKAAQDASGRFSIQKQRYPNGEIVPLESQYYPGEAIFALVRLYEVIPRQEWLDHAEAAARYLITVRDAGKSDRELIHDHWLLYGLSELYPLRPRPAFLSHTRRLVSVIVARQNRDPRYPDWLGSYYRPPRSTPTATRSEGLAAAYRLLRKFGTSQETAPIEEAIRLGVRFDLQTQFRPENALWFSDPMRVLGAFHRSLTNFKIRIDYVQHNISALLGLYEILAEPDGSMERPLANERKQAGGRPGSSSR